LPFCCSRHRSPSLNRVPYLPLSMVSCRLQSCPLLLVNADGLGFGLTSFRIFLLIIFAPSRAGLPHSHFIDLGAGSTFAVMHIPLKEGPVTVWIYVDPSNGLRPRSHQCVRRPGLRGRGSKTNDRRRRVEYGFWSEPFYRRTCNRLAKQCRVLVRGCLFCATDFSPRRYS